MNLMSFYWNMQHLSSIHPLNLKIIFLFDMFVVSLPGQAQPGPTGLGWAGLGWLEMAGIILCFSNSDENNIDIIQTY